MESLLSTAETENGNENNTPVMTKRNQERVHTDARGRADVRWIAAEALSHSISLAKTAGGRLIGGFYSVCGVGDDHLDIDIKVDDDLLHGERFPWSNM